MRCALLFVLAVLLGVVGSPSARAAPQRVLAVFSHPDDELFCAGTLARAAVAGADVQVVYTTSGNRGKDVSHGGLGTRVATKLARRLTGARRLSRRREAETRRALRALGVEREPRFLRLGDGAVTRNLFRAAERLARLLRDLDPDWVLTMGPQGVTGHRDHIATSTAVSVAFQREAPRARLLHVVFTVERARLFRSFWVLKVVDPSVVDHRVPVREVASARAAALAAHRTQFTRARLRRFRDEVLANDGYDELREVEGRGAPPALLFGPRQEGPAAEP